MSAAGSVARVVLTAVATAGTETGGAAGVLAAVEADAVAG